MKRIWFVWMSVLGLCSAAGGAQLSSASYVQDGLVTQFDAIENVGVGQHDATATVWRDLKGSASITVNSGATWGDRMLDAAKVEHAIVGMSAFYLDSVSSEVALHVRSAGPDGKYPRIIHHRGSDGLYSVYFEGLSAYVRFFIDNISWPRPSTGNLIAGTTIGMTSDTKGYRAYQNGILGENSGTTVATHTEAPASTWTLNRQNGGYLDASYYAFRHYTRALTVDELQRNARIDLFRFFSHAIVGDGAAEARAWATAGWLVPPTSDGMFPSTTNEVARIVNAKVAVAATDDIALRGLSLEDGATLDLSSGAEVRVKLLLIETQPVTRGVYTGVGGRIGTVVDWISGTGCVCVAGNETAKFPTASLGLSASSYVMDGLVTQFDAIDNVGTGQHDPDAAKWLDLIGKVSLMPTGDARWDAGRYFYKGTNQLALSVMPAYRRNSMTCEVSVNIVTNGSNGAGGYPRIFSHGENFSFYFIGSGKTAFLYINGQSPDTRPEAGAFRVGTLVGFSGTDDYGIALDGVVKQTAKKPVTVNVEKASETWYLGVSGLLVGSYGGLRFYNRCLTKEEMAWNALVDKFRYFSYAYSSEDEEPVVWSDVVWGIPIGKTAAAPDATTNDYVTIKGAVVNAGATDAIALAGLSLEDNAKLTLTQDAVVSVKMLFVNGVAIPHGIYTGAEGTAGIVADWISGAGQVRVAGDLSARIPFRVPTPAAGGWYEFGLENGSASARHIVGDYPHWDEYAFPPGAKLRLKGYILLETVPDVFAEYDTTQLKYAMVKDARAYASEHPFAVPTGATFRFLAGNWKTYANSSNVLEHADVNWTEMASAAGNVALDGNAVFYLWGDGLPNLGYSGCLSGTGKITVTSYGRQMRFTGGFACQADVSAGQNGNGIWIDSCAVTGRLGTVTLSSCGDQWGITEEYSASFLMFGRDGSDQTADHPLPVARLNANASSRVDANGRRWRSGGHVIVWGSNTVQIADLRTSLHAVGCREEQDCRNSLLDVDTLTSKGIGFLEIDTFTSGTIFGSTNIALTVGTASSGTAFDYTYQSNGVNRLTLDITESCAANVSVTATDLAMLPARISGLAGTVSLTDTAARNYEIPVDLTVGPDGLNNMVGCNGSGTLVAAPETSAINITFPTEGVDPDDILPGKYPIARFSAGGNLLRQWTVTLNGEQTATTNIGRHSIRACRDATGIWLGVDLPGCVIIFR